MTKLLPALGALALAAAPAAAKDTDIVSARDPEGAFKALVDAGYETDRHEKDGKLSEFSVKEAGWWIDVLFQDCDDDKPDQCDTIVLSTGFDREHQPISDKAVAEANLNLKYVSVFRDDEGDPRLQWALYTGDIGVSKVLFLRMFRLYASVVDDFALTAFDGDEPTETASNADGSAESLPAN